MWLFVAGGAPMIVIVVFGLVAIGAAGRFAYAPSPGRVAHIVALCIAVVFASLTGVCADLVAVSIKVPEHPEWIEEHGLGMILLMGFGEALSPAILGFSMVSIASLATAVGLRRAPDVRAVLAEAA